MLERPAGIEPVVFCLEGSGSAIELRTLKREPLSLHGPEVQHRG